MSKHADNQERRNLINVANTLDGILEAYELNDAEGEAVYEAAEFIRKHLTGVQHD
jgi:hypothetical protein